MQLTDRQIDVIQKARGGHSIFSPSSSAMWSTCPGSLIPNLLSGDNAGQDAAEGTVGHEVAEEWLTSDRRPIHLVGTTRTVQEAHESFEVEITWEMLDYIEQYVEWCSMLPGEHYIETRADFSDLTPIPKQSGTSDHAACYDQTLVISDLKYGKGVQVWAKENTQLILYAYGFFKKYDHLYNFQKIILRIGQPRLDHFDEGEITRETLLERAQWLKVRAHAAWQIDAPRKPSIKACQWCNIKSGCSALFVLMMRILDGDIASLARDITTEETEEKMSVLDSSDEIQAIEIDQLTTAQKGRIYQYRRLVERFFTDLQNDLQERVSRGEEVEGCKLVNGRTNRTFMSENKVLEHLDFLGVDLEQMYERKMLSPAKTEEVLRKTGYSRKVIPILLDPVVIKTEGKPTLALDTDRRKALKSVDAGVFDDDEL